MPAVARKLSERLVFEQKGLATFLRLDAGVPRFKKEILRVGKWIHPVTRQEIDFDRARLANLALNTNRWMQIGHDVWFPAGHNTDPTKNLGTWERGSVALEGDSLTAIVDVLDDDAAAKVGKTITGVSVDIKFNQPASNGEVFDEVIVHVAATPCPVIPDQPNFVRLAIEYGQNDKRRAELAMQMKKTQTLKTVTQVSHGGGEGVKNKTTALVPGTKLDEGDGGDDTGAPSGDGDSGASSASGGDGGGDGSGAGSDGAAGAGLDDESCSAEKGPLNKGQALKVAGLDADPLTSVRAALGLPADADQGSIIEAIRAMTEDNVKDDQNGGKDGVAVVAPQTPAIAALSLEIKKLRDENSRVRREAATREVQLAREASAKGVPIDKDTSDLALDLLASESDRDRKTGRKMLELAMGHSDLARKARLDGVAPLASPGAKADDKVKKSKGAVEEMLLSLNYEVAERGADGIATKMKSPSGDLVLVQVPTD